MKKWWWSERISLVTMMLLKTKGIIWSYIGLIWPYWKSLELNYFTNIYLNECISIVLLLLLQKRTVNRSFSFRNPKESWISSFVMIVEISTEHRALNHIPFIYLIFLGEKYWQRMNKIGLAKVMINNKEWTRPEPSKVLKKKGRNCPI